MTGLDDQVWSKNQYTPSAPGELARVSEVYRRTVDHLRILQIQDADGNVETIRTTDDHPFWVQGKGWTLAKNLILGETFSEADHSDNATLISTATEAHPEGFSVYNFQVAGDHSYFVEDGSGEQTAVWVHNSCFPLPEKPGWAKNARTFLGWLLGLERHAKGNGGRVSVSAAEADALIAEAKQYGLSVRLDPPHPSTPWDVPHLNIMGDSANVHIEVPLGYDNPSIPHGS